MVSNLQSNNNNGTFQLKCQNIIYNKSHIYNPYNFEEKIDETNPYGHCNSSDIGEDSKTLGEDWPAWHRPSFDDDYPSSVDNDDPDKVKNNYHFKLYLLKMTLN